LEPEPIVSGLADKRDGYLVLFALKHGWRTVSVRFRRSPERVRVVLDAPAWEEGSRPDDDVASLARWLAERGP
jgi:hypothetical protein